MATIKDVAKRAGVSPSTVSYALSGKRPISAKVKQRVGSAIEALNFTPNALAHNLRRGSSGVVGLVFPLRETLAEEMSVGFIATAAEALRSSHTLSLFTGTRTPDELLEVLRQNRADGLILMEITRQDPRVELLRHSDVPFSLIGRPENADGLSLVDFDFETAAYEAIRHLVALGHGTIGYIDFPKDRNQGLGYALHSQRGYERARQDFAVSLLYQESGPSMQDGYDATESLLKRATDLSAIVALVGITQFGVLRALADLGRRVPQDCSVICSGAATTAHWSSPRLSCVPVPFGDLGRIGAELLLERLAGEPPRQVLLPARVLAAESTAPAPER